ncbi:TPA: hypothetical protein ACQIUU_003103, partial [Escherichia coli]
PNFATTVTNSLAGKMDKSANGSDIENVSVFLQNLQLGEGAKLAAATGLLAKAGYFEWPGKINGKDKKLIIQWCRVSSDSSGAATAVLPKAFPNEILHAIPVDAGATSSSWGIGAAATIWGWDSSTSTKTTVVARVYRLPNGGALSGALGCIFVIGY